MSTRRCVVAACHVLADPAVADEYTALQKYISTYRDPKAALADEANAKKDAKDAGKGKLWWQVSITKYDSILTELSR